MFTLCLSVSMTKFQKMLIMENESVSQKLSIFPVPLFQKNNAIPMISE